MLHGKVSGYVLGFTLFSTSVAIVIPSEVVLQRGRNVSGKSLATAGSVVGYLVLEDLPYCSPAQLFEWGLDPTTQPGPFLEKLSSLIMSGSSIQCTLPWHCAFATLISRDMMVR